MPAAPDKKRRSFLERCLRWSGVLFTILLSYPLIRFTGYTIKPKPRHIKVAPPLNSGGYHTHHEFILFTGSDEPKALSRICTHLGCRVNYREELEVIECPCHQSRYTLDGVRTSGPAKRNLATLPVETQRDPQGVITGYTVTL